MRPATPISDEIYQLKVTLRDSQPGIWRLVQVPGNISLHKLHLILQAAMGWKDSHLYQFYIKGVSYEIPDPDEVAFDGSQVKDARRTILRKIVPMDETMFLYVYDFGDNWRHDIAVERIGVKESGVHYPVCVAGARACPPEDCGGISGYTELLEIISNPRHEDYQDMKEWVGKRFDPEKFTIQKVNRLLKNL